MKDHFEVIRTLSNSEFAQFGIFLNSQLHNTSVRLRDYYNFLKKNHKKYITGSLTKEEIKSKFLKSKTLADEQKAEINYRKLISDFNKLLNDYLVYLENEKDDIAAKISLLRSYRTRGLSKRFSSLAADIAEEFADTIPLTSIDYYNRRRFYEELRLNTFSTDYHAASPVIEEESGAIDLTFIIDKLGAYQNMFSLEYVSKKNKHGWTFFDEVSRHIELNTDEIKTSHPAVYFNYTILKLARNPSDIKMYLDLKSFLDKNLSSIPPSRLKRFTFDLINYCYLKVNEGHRDFRKEIHSLIIFLDENDLLLADGDINHSYFKSTIDNITTLRELDWLEYFLDKYSPHIEKDYRDSLTNLAYTKLYLYKGEYDKARDYEKNISYKDYIHYIDAKLTLARIEYEASNTDSVYSVIDSVKKYLNKSASISEYYHFFYKNFINNFTDLIKITEKTFTGINTGFELDKLKKKINGESKPFYGKLWLLSKIEQI